MLKAKATSNGFRNIVSALFSKKYGGRPNTKKRKTDASCVEEKIDTKNETKNIVDYKQLDPNSNEYWLELRKSLNIK